MLQLSGGVEASEFTDLPKLKGSVPSGCCLPIFPGEFLLFSGCWATNKVRCLLLLVSDSPNEWLIREKSEESLASCWMRTRWLKLLRPLELV